MSRPSPSVSVDFLLKLPNLPLARGGVVRQHRLHGWWLGPAGDTPEQPLPGVRTVLLVPALTGSARAGGPGGWWAPLIGRGRALDPRRCRVICFSNLGSFYGSSAPGVPGFPLGGKISLTSLDLARSILLGLDALGIRRVQLAAGGSLGGMVVLSLAALAPRRFERILPLATTAATSAWVAGWNHVARAIIRLDPGYPDNVGRGLEVARQLAMLTYRAEPGFAARFTSRASPIAGYLEHHGKKLHHRFTPRCYELLLAAMDHHDLLAPLPRQRTPALARIRASTLVVDIDSDQLFTPAQSTALVRELRRHRHAHVRRATIRSPHGHDAFLLEWRQLAALVRQAVRLPAPR